VVIELTKFLLCSAHLRLSAA